MPYIETVDDLVEHLADLAGIYGGCDHESVEGWTCDMCAVKCRIWFQEEYSRRIFQAVRNDKLLQEMEKVKA